MENKIIQRVNELGGRHGFPIFIMEDGTVYKIPPLSKKLKFIVPKEINPYGLISKQLLGYDEWIRKYSVQPTCPKPPEEPCHPLTASLPDFPKVPAHLKPEAYRFGSSVFYIFAEPYIRRQFEVKAETILFGMAAEIKILFAPGTHFEISVYKSEKDGRREEQFVYVYEKNVH